MITMFLQIGMCKIMITGKT